jgi:UV DNA damage endonuclease
MKRFIERFNQIPQEIQKRLVIENDDRLYSLVDCLSIHHETGIPILFDNLHHECLNTGESLNNAFKSFTTTWHTSDGIPMVDYSEQAEGARIGKHRESLEVSRFTEYLNETSEYDFDIMLEIKDKEKSAMRAIAIMQQLQLDEVTPVGNRVLE